jgi:hypothetical protein
MPAEQATIVSTSSIYWAEQEVVERTAEGVWAQFSQEQGTRPRVRAIFLRRLLLGLSAPEGGDRSPSLPRIAGVRVRGAYIEGKLDLSDCTGPEGTPLPALALEECDIPDAIDLSHSRLVRFSVGSSRISHIRAHGTRLAEGLDFSHVSSYEASINNGEEENHIAWIDSHGARIGGHVDGRAARLRAPPPRPAADVLPGMQRYALRLSGSEIRGGIDLMDSRAFGGVNFSDSDICGEVWLRSAIVTSGESDAFRGQSARFASVLVLDDGFVADGSIWLLAASISGDLQCGAATLKSEAKDGSGHSLVADNAEFGGQVNLSTAKVSGQVVLSGTRIGRDLNLNGVSALGQIGLAAAKIGGDLNCASAILENRTEDGTGTTLEASNAEIGGNVFISGASVSGRIGLNNIKIGGDFICEHSTFANRTDDGTGDAVSAELAQIGGGALLRGASFNAQGRVDLIGATIRGDVDCSDASFENRTNEGDGTALTFERTTIGGRSFYKERNFGLPAKSACTGRTSMEAFTAPARVSKTEQRTAAAAL